MDNEFLDKMFERQDELFALQPKCPRCSSPQVQLRDMYQRPAQWRCRMCSTKFSADILDSKKSGK